MQQGGSYEYKYQLLVNCTILKDCISRYKNLGTAWIDNKKATQHNMTILNTYVFLSHYNEVGKPSYININKGIFLYGCSYNVKYDSELEGCLISVKHLSDDMATFNNRQLVKKTSIKPNQDAIVKELDQGELYQYLKGNEVDSTQHPSLKEKIWEDCYR